MLRLSVARRMDFVAPRKNSARRRMTMRPIVKVIVINPAQRTKMEKLTRDVIHIIEVRIVKISYVVQGRCDVGVRGAFHKT